MQSQRPRRKRPHQHMAAPILDKRPKCAKQSPVKQTPVCHGQQHCRQSPNRHINQAISNNINFTPPRPRSNQIMAAPRMLPMPAIPRKRPGKKLRPFRRLPTSPTSLLRPNPRILTSQLGKRPLTRPGHFKRRPLPLRLRRTWRDRQRLRVRMCLRRILFPAIPRHRWDTRPALPLPPVGRHGPSLSARLTTRKIPDLPPPPRCHLSQRNRMGQRTRRSTSGVMAIQRAIPNGRVSRGPLPGRARQEIRRRPLQDLQTATDRRRAVMALTHPGPARDDPILLNNIRHSSVSNLLRHRSPSSQGRRFTPKVDQASLSHLMPWNQRRRSASVAGPRSPCPC